MRAHFTPFILASFVAIGCGPADQAETVDSTQPAAAATDASAAEEAALDALRASYVQHNNMHHADIVAAMYADSAVGLWANGEISVGRSAIQTYLETQYVGSPTLELTGDETMVFGDNAVTRGTWRVATTPEGGAAMNVSGQYMTVFGKVADEWKIGAVLTNFSAPPPADMPMGAGPADPPPDMGTLGTLVTAWTEHYNAGDGAAVAALYADDAHVAFADAPAVTGRAAVASLLAERMAPGATIEIHDVETTDLGDGWAGDGGWYTLTMPADGGGTTTRSGTYMMLVRQQADGSWRIHWHISNGLTGS